MNVWKFTKIHLLNLPDKEHNASKEAELRQRYAEPAPAAPSGGLDAWAKASRQASAQVTNKPAMQGNVWADAEETRKQKLWVRFVRGLIVAVLLLAVITGVRSWIWPNQGPAPEPIPAAVTFPSAEAAGTAERFAAAYLTWDEETPEQRTAALSSVVAGGGTGLMGWNGNGKQTATDVHTESVAVETDTAARVTVTASVTPYEFAAAEGKDDADAWEPMDPRRVAIEVQVHIINGRAAVVGRPGYVALPAPNNAPDMTTPAEDPELTDSTEPHAAQFFAAYGEESDVSALTAPDSRIPGLGGALTFDELTSWTVFEGRGETRQAAAVVQWQTGTTQIEQTYRLTLAKVTGAGANRWQISSLNGGDF